MSSMTMTSGRSDPTASRTRALLLCGAVAGPLYLAVGLIEAFTRPGFDIRRHDLSLLANGDLGWIHMLDLIVTGLLVIAGAAGMRRALARGRGRTWGPLLVGVFGAGMVAAGVFVADPALGFPPGTPADAHAVSWHGLLHLAFAGVGFLSLIAGCFVFARRFAAGGERGWAAYSAFTGAAFLVTFGGAIAVSAGGWSVLSLWIGVVLAFAWVTATCVRLVRQQPYAAAEALTQ